jgi:hypothetical protein
MLVSDRSNIGTNLILKKTGKNVDFLEKKNFTIQVIGRLHDIQCEQYEVSELFWNVLVLRMLNQVRRNDFQSVQSGVCSEFDCLELYLQ